MTDERLCGWLDCGLPEDHPHHRDRAFFEWHPFEAAPSTDEGEARWAREIAERWVNGATAEDRETVVLTECDKHPGVMPEWACPTCARAPLDERIRELQTADIS